MSTPTLVVTDNAVRLQPCALYKGHACAVVNAHHICPQSWFKAAGVKVDTPMISLCPTCHSNVHACIDGILAGRDIRAIPSRCRGLAQQGLAIARERGLTPGPTL